MTKQLHKQFVTSTNTLYRSFKFSFFSVCFIFLTGLYGNHLSAQTVLWSEDFETIQSTSCAQTTGGLTNTVCIPANWLTRNTYPLVATSQLTHNLSDRALKFLGVLSTSKTGWVMTHGTALTAGVAYELKFWWRTGGTAAGTYTINVGASTNQNTVPTALTQVVSSSANSNTHLEYTYAFTPATSGTYYFGLRFTLANSASGPRDLIIDDVSLTQSCTPPTAPTVGAITQPTCGTPTGSVDLSNLPASGTWTLTRNPGGITSTGTGTTTTVSGLPANAAYTFTVNDGVSACPSAATGNVVINAAPAPVAPSAITGTNQVCAGSASTLTATGGDANTKWYTGNCGGTLAGTGASFTTPAVNNAVTYYAANEVCGNISTCASLNITLTPAVVPPTSITGNATICGNTTTTLTAVGGDVNTKWYTTGCGGTQAGTGASFTTPAINSAVTYYAANEVCGSLSSCQSIDITLIPGAVAPSAITGNTSICTNASTTLTAVGANALSKWFTGSCGGTQVGTGASFTTPVLTGNATYYAANEVCGSISACESVTVTVSPSAVAPSAITGNNTICQNSATTLTAVGGDVNTKWYSGSCGGTQVGAGASFTSPALNADVTYYAANEACSTLSSCASLSITVTATAVAPSAITGSSTVCENTTTTLTAAGGDAATKWFTGSCGGTQVGTGASFTSPVLTGNVTYYAANEACSTLSSCASLSITVTPAAVAPSAITGSTSICESTTTTLTAAGGDATTKWFTGNCGGAQVGAGASFTSPALTGNVTYYAANEACATLSSCVSAAITVNALPVVSLAPFATLCSADAVLTLTGGSPAGGSYSVNGTPATSFDPAAGAGSYTVTYQYTDGNTCSAEATATITVTVCSGIAENEDNAIQLYPNPVAGELFISLNKGSYIIVVYDAIGKQMESYQWEMSNTGIKSINTLALSNGLYYINIVSAATGKTNNIKFIVTH